MESTHDNFQMKFNKEVIAVEFESICGHLRV